MLFNSLRFLIFFPIVTLVYFLIPHKVRYLWLLGASYYFYMCWNPQYALLIAASTVFTWLGGFVISKTKKPAYRKLAVGLNFAVNLLILFFFKYFTFTLDNINLVLGIFGISPLNAKFDVLLPVGISFYTFQALGYTVDVYRGDVEHEKNPFRYALFVSFFPQLVAGPIERSKNLILQLKEKHKFDYDLMVSGLLLMFWGFFQKVVIADRAAILVDTVYNNPTVFSGFHLAVATVVFAIQIYCDFASYTTIARGAARIMGFELIENFRAPYLAVSIADFWTRWHLSLTNWFRDYLYIPLGGNRKGKVRKYVNIFIVFLSSGLWHGANWTYIIWGLIHGIARILGDLTENLRKLFLSLIGVKRDTPQFTWVRRIITFTIVCFSWIFFRCTSLSDAFYIIQKILFSFNPSLIFGRGFMEMGLSTPDLFVLLISIVILIFADKLKYKNFGANKAIMDMHLILRYVLFLFLIFATLVFGIYGPGYEATQFIYFQF
ncbi:MAG: MBOAT family O-acyltransferase [Clostridia bacterium]|nr:MBOAT family O-acyltransferase [Clostridia bacterium]